MEETTKNNFLGVEKVGKLMRMFAIPCVLSLMEPHWRLSSDS